MIILANSAGFCFGVDRAVNLVYNLIDKKMKVATLGPIIHNPQLVADLIKKGCRIIENPEDAAGDECIVIRSHGVEEEIYQVLEQSGRQYVDATCPFVAKIHEIVKKKSQEGCFILIAGDPHHPEVQGILSRCLHEKNRVIQNPAGIVALLKSRPEFEKIPMVLVAQTTFDMESWKACKRFAQDSFETIQIYDTICSATAIRQKEAEELAGRSDLMVVIGGKESSNTQKLYRVCSSRCKTYHIETAAELVGADFENIKNIGLTAGASTPGCIIKEVLKNMSEIMERNDMEEEFDFAQALEGSLKTVGVGEIVEGIVAGVASTEVQVDIGTKHAGFVPLSEFSSSDAETIKVGDSFYFIVTHVSDSEGTVTLSKKRFDAMRGWKEIEKAKEDGTILEAAVSEIVKGGLIALFQSVKVFVPASLASLYRSDSLEPLLKQNVRFQIIEADPRKRRVIGSIKAVLQLERKEQEEAFWKNAEVGKKYQGIVKSFTSYGAFVDLGSVDGMIHISELSWQRVKHPSKVLSIGDKIEVYIKALDVENRKISLGYRKEEDNPWTIFTSQYHAGDTVNVKIVNLMPFGAFGQIMPGIDGLIHISQISRNRIEKPQDVLRVGDTADVIITEIDTEKRRISLSMRALLPEEETDEPAESDSENSSESTIEE